MSRDLARLARRAKLQAITLRRLGYPDDVVNRELELAAKLKQMADEQEQRRTRQLALDEGIDNADW